MKGTDDMDLANCGDNLGPPYCLPTCTELSVAEKGLCDFFNDKVKNGGMKSLIYSLLVTNQLY